MKGIGFLFLLFLSAPVFSETSKQTEAFPHHFESFLAQFQELLKKEDLNKLSKLSFETDPSNSSGTSLFPTLTQEPKTRDILKLKLDIKHCRSFALKDTEPAQFMVSCLLEVPKQPFTRGNDKVPGEAYRWNEKKEDWEKVPLHKFKMFNPAPFALFLYNGHVWGFIGGVKSSIYTK